MSSLSARDQRLAADLAALARMPVLAPRRRPPSCDTCVHHQADRINPPGGLGHCKAGHGARYPGVRLNCADFKSLS